MAITRMNPMVDKFMNRQKTWQEEYEKLREICLDAGLTEHYKWMHPCYTLEDKNVVLIHSFKDYIALLFHKGVLLKDTQAILIQQTENVQAGRQLRFADLREIVEKEAVIKAYIQEAIEVEKSGAEVVYKKTEEFEAPEEFTKKCEEYPAFKAAFEGLTPGRQKGYLLYFSQAKQAKTREARIEKYFQPILDGKGIDD